MRRLCIALALLGAALPACSSDALPEPDPKLEQPGAFVAVDEEGEGPLTLLRTLSPLSHETGDVILFVTVYNAAPMSWKEAREIAKRHDIPVANPLMYLSRSLLVQNPYQVVWFRTLTEEEEERVP